MPPPPVKEETRSFFLSSFFLHCNENPIYVFPFWKLRGPQSQFSHSCVCERFIYPQDQSTYFLQQNRQNNRSQTHECGNWNCGRAMSLLGIFVSNFRYWFFAVCSPLPSAETATMVHPFPLPLVFSLSTICKFFTVHARLNYTDKKRK
jgi:hypothetical protein